MSRGWFLPVAAGACLLVGALVTPIGAAPLNFADNLVCSDIKDYAHHTRFSAELVSNFFGIKSGCSISVPAKMLCVPAAKQSVSPPPPGGAPDGANLVLNNYLLCYRARCPKSVGFNDEFIAWDQLGGARLVKVRSTKLLCAPGS